MADQTEQITSGEHHFCAHCGTENEKNGYACNRCGERLIEVQADTASHIGLNSCARCGNANNTRAAYCWVCGSEMKDSVRITPVPSREIEVPSATTPRTYRPDLNPVSTPVNKPSTGTSGNQPEHSGPESVGNSETPISQQNPFGSENSSTPNSSGTRDAEVPPEIKKWNWAAFLMPAVWGLFSGVPYTAVLFGAALLPPLAQLVVMVTASLYLGARGNELAWRGKKWRSVEHFQAFQKQWTSWAVKLTVAVGAILLFYYIATGGG